MKGRELLLAALTFLSTVASTTAVIVVEEINDSIQSLDARVGRLESHFIDAPFNMIDSLSAQRYNRSERRMP